MLASYVTTTACTAGAPGRPLDAAGASDYGQRMSDPQIGEVRRCNRTVTAHVGALNDRFLGRGRSLGEARLLWEIGPAGAEMRALRSRLRLDSGYLSRLLRSLERAGLVAVAPDEADG